MNKILIETLVFLPAASPDVPKSESMPAELDSELVAPI